MISAVIVIFSYFFLLFIIATIIKNNSIVDIGWGFGFVLTSWVVFFQSGDFSVEKLIINGLISLWGLRLFYHILRRNAFQEEDFRYAQWRKDWGKWVIPRAFLQVFMLQGFFMFVVGIGAYYININGGTFQIVTVLGIIVYTVGYVFEAVGDKQLRDHVNAKKGSLLTTGLWKYTRHPNYFGEAVIWWGVFIVAFSFGAPLFVIISPIAITWLLRFVSGVPLLERKMQKKDGWEEYASRTNAFIPWVVKR